MFPWRLRGQYERSLAILLGTGGSLGVNGDGEQGIALAEDELLPVGGRADLCGMVTFVTPHR